jgi:hypothetical protein
MNNMKSGFYLGILLSLMFSIVNSQTLDDSLKLFYPFNGNALDLSGNGNDGKVLGATPTYDRYGNANSAYDFDGINDLIITKYSFDYELRTVSVWVKADNIMGSNFYSKNFLSQDSYQLDWGLFESKFVDGSLTIRAGGEYSPFMIAGNSGSWFHIVLIRDYELCSYYVNGQFIGSALSGFVGSTYNPNVNLVIGAGRAMTNQYFDGVIDDLRIYNRVLSEEEVLSLYDETILQTHEETSEFSLYPNPTKDNAFIDFNNPLPENSELSIYDNSGRLISKQNGLSKTKISFETGNLESGMYFIMISSNNSIHYKGKLIKEI